MGESLPNASLLALGDTSVLDIDALIQPIPGDAPTGVDLREDASPNSVYYQLREVRTVARNNERAALADGESDYIAKSDWADILSLAPEVLRERSKDLEVVAWLIEALTRTYGFKGVALGFTLAQQLIERFGSALYPLPDEDGVASQVAALTGLNGIGSDGALIAPLKSIPLTEDVHPGPFSAWQCEQAFATDRIGDEARRNARSKRGFVSGTEIQAAVAETSTAFLVRTHQELSAAIEAFDRYQATLDAHCQDAPQPTSRIAETLESVMHTLRHIAGERLTAALAPAEGEGAGADEDAAEPAAETETEAAPVAARPKGLDRESALRQLQEIAAFFRRTEPHSPISYSLEQAIYWSQLSLPDLIRELIPDENARSKFQTLAGIRTKED